MQFFTMSYKGSAITISEYIMPSKYDRRIEYTCEACGRGIAAFVDCDFYREPMDVITYGNGKEWPDMPASGDLVFYSLVSQRVLDIWEAEGIGKIPAFPVTVVPPFPKRVVGPPPTYYRLAHKEMVGAEFDWLASGFLDVHECDVCGLLSWDITMSDRLCHFQITPYVMKEETWNGSHVFYANQTANVFCTEKVVDIAHKYKMTNFEFTPLEIANSAIDFPGVDYKVKDWRKKLVKDLEKHRKKFYEIRDKYYPVNPLTGKRYDEE